MLEQGTTAPDRTVFIILSSVPFLCSSSSVPLLLSSITRGDAGQPIAGARRASNGEAFWFGGWKHFVGASFKAAGGVSFVHCALYHNFRKVN